MHIYIFGIFGLLIGSFLNVVINRKETGENLGGRSHCNNCKYTLRWFDLIPVISWITLRGKCRECKGKISIQYPLVEILTAIVFAYLASVTTDVYILIYQFIIASLFIAIFVFDLKHMIIPDVWSYPLAVLSFIPYLINFNFSLDLFSGIILALPFYLLWKVSNGKWIGLGDAKLLLSIGWILGLALGLTSIAIASWLGLLYALLVMLIHQLNLSSKNITMKTAIPFGPFLILAFAIQYIYSLDLFSLSYII